MIFLYGIGAGLLVFVGLMYTNRNEKNAHGRYMLSWASLFVGIVAMVLVWVIGAINHFFF